MKILSLFIILFFLTNCSFNKQSKIWNYNENDNSFDKSIVSGYDSEFDEYKKSILNYSKNANYPDIN